MKTAIKSLISGVLTLVVLTGSAMVSKADDNKTVTVLSEVKKVKKINVSGNVELILVHSENESVNVYDSYYAKNALVQQKDGELRIASYDNQTLQVVVYVSNLSELTASENARVKTFGKFSSVDLSIILKDNAVADLNTNTISLSTNINDKATLSLTGSTLDYNAVMSNTSNVATVNFVAENSNIRSKSAPVEKLTKDLSVAFAE
ncbi:MAG: hypothetical protein EOO90_01310 [Pedobacter sp.]|nr:MAG: hypothetical protein EOO90_01310 [Pedobacter sp.]